jgi:hypothetical protein
MAYDYEYECYIQRCQNVLEAHKGLPFLSQCDSIKRVLNARDIDIDDEYDLPWQSFFLVLNRLAIDAGAIAYTYTDDLGDIFFFESEEAVTKFLLEFS